MHKRTESQKIYSRMITSAKKRITNDIIYTYQMIFMTQLQSSGAGFYVGHQYIGSAVGVKEHRHNG